MDGSTLEAPVIRTLKRRSKSRTNLAETEEKVKLERVLGLTVNSGASLSCDPVNGVIAYPAGCTVVLYNSKKNKQSHIINSSKKTITCVSFSPDGRYLATGEQGHEPAVRVWDAQEKTQVASFLGHKYAVKCVAFSPNMKDLISIGNEFDMNINVWNWRSNSKVASNKVSSKVKAVSFSENGSYFVTAGIRHVKFWYLERSKASSKYQDTVPLSGRSAILSEQRNNSFCDIACGRGASAASTFCITQSGLLCEFDSKRMLKKWAQLNASSAYCLTVGPQQIFVGCSDAIVRVFQLDTLQYVTTLPKCHYLGVDVSAGVSASHMVSKKENAKYPDVIALCYDEKNKCVSCVYSDHSLYQWDVQDYKRIGKIVSFLYHSACIWGIEMYPNIPPDENGSSRVPCLPPGSFITCSSDDTIRVWNLDPNLPSPTASISPDAVMSSLSPLNRRNIYSPELLKVFYVDKDLQYICDATHTSGNAGETNDAQYDGRNGVRSVVVSPDGRHLASGDRTGTLRIFDLTTMNCIVQSEAHESEVLCLEYSLPEFGSPLLVSASRDRLIHIFDVNCRYEFVTTVDDHSSSITAVKFAAYDNNMYMLSCGADKSLIFRQVTWNPEVTFTRVNHVVGKTTLYDMDVDPNQEWVYTACNDRQIRVYNLRTGKHQRSFKGSLSDDGTLLKLNFDDSGLYAASSCSDKQVYIVQSSTGDCVATMSGHSELVTGLKFSHDCRHVITISGDGCIFIWRLSSEMRTNMLNRLNFLRSQSGAPLSHSLLSPTPRDEDTDDTGETPEDYVPVDNSASPGLNINLSELPRWARQQLGTISGNTPAKDTPDLIKPQGKWAQRAAGSLHLAEDPDSNSFVRSPSLDEGQDEIFMGPGSLDIIRRKFQEDSQRDSLYAASTGMNRGKLFSASKDDSHNVKLEPEDDEFLAPKVDAVLYIPQEADRDGSFEVKERSDMLKANKPYSRSDTMADLSDEEPDISLSSNNLSALAAERRNLSHSVEDVDRQEQMLKAAFELDQPDSHQGSSMERSMTPSMMERNTPLRQSITARFLERTGSERRGSPLVTPLKATVGSEAQQYRPANAVNPPVPTKPPTYVSHFVKTETSQVSPYAPSDKKINKWSSPVDPFLHPGNIESRPSSSTSTLSGPSTDRSDEINYGARLAFHNRERYVSNMIDSPRKTPAHSILPSATATTVNASGPTTWSYKRPPAPNSLKKREQEPDTPVDESLIRRARSLSQLARDKARRKTLPDAYFLSELDDDGSVSSRRDDEMRSRHTSSRYDSPTPSSEYSIPQTPKSAGLPSHFKNRSYFGTPPSHVATVISPTFSAGSQTFGSMAKFRSMSSLSQAASTPTKFSDENPMFKRISDLRTKLKKSTENLALSPCDVERLALRDDGPMGSFSRSKSYGNLTGNGETRVFSPPATPTDSHFSAMKSEPQSNLKRTSNLTKSLQNLHALTRGHAPLPDVTQFQQSRDSAADLRRVSSGGFTDANEAEDRVPLMPEVGSYYDRATSLPRSRHSKSAVQKKANTVRSIKHNSSGYHVDRMSASGDSDSSESVPMAYGSSGSYNYRRNSANSETRYASPRRQVRSYVNGLQSEGNNSSELSPKDRNNNMGLRNDQSRGPGSPQSSRLYGTPDSGDTTPRRASQNHYAKLMAGGDGSFDGRTSKNYVDALKHRSDLSNLSRSDRYAADKLDGKMSGRETPDRPGSSGNHYEKMSRHCQDSIGEFRTSLDKVIQAYQLVANDQELSDKEREGLLNVLGGELEGAYKRVGQTLHIPMGERIEPEGRHVDETSSNHNLSGTGSSRSGIVSGVTPGGISIPGAGQDPAVLLQNYADMIMNMVQQKMANANNRGNN